MISQEALPLAQHYQENLERLNEWLDIVNADLEHLDDATPEEQVDLLQNMLEDAENFRTDMEGMILAGSRLAQLSPGEGAEALQKCSETTARRFDQTIAVIQRASERAQINAQPSTAAVTAVDDLHEWFAEAEDRLKKARNHASADVDLVRQQLRDHRILHGDVHAQKARIKDVVQSCSRLMHQCDERERQAIQERVDVSFHFQFLKFCFDIQQSAKWTF